MSEYMNEKFDYIINKTDEMIDELIDYFIKDKALLKDYLRKQSKEKEELEQHKNTLEQYLRIEKEVSNETIKELEQQKAELIEYLTYLYTSQLIKSQRLTDILNKYK